jgi:hypothetical protein
MDNSMTDLKRGFQDSRAISRKSKKSLAQSDFIDGFSRSSGNKVDILLNNRNHVWRSLETTELHQVKITPSILNFENVTVGSVGSKNLMIHNSLSENILVALEIDCEELQSGF